MPEIAAKLSPEAINRAQLVLTFFLLGIGVGTFVAGPLSDAIGRKRTIVVGVSIFVIGAVIGAQAQSPKCCWRRGSCRIRRRRPADRADGAGARHVFRA
ncbi:MFS transporter [Rhodobacter capsulatus]